MITKTSARALSLAACWLGVCGLGGCAGAQTPREARLNRAFGRIQVHEAEIVREQAAVQRGTGTADCRGRSRAAAEICRHAEGICELARELADADALARCAQAEDACTAARARVHDCPPGAGPTS